MASPKVQFTRSYVTLASVENHPHFGAFPRAAEKGQLLDGLGWPGDRL